MGRRKSKAKASTSNRSHEDNLPVETTGAEIVVSNSVMVDAADSYILCQNEYEVKTLEEAGEEANPALVSCNNVGKNKIVAAEEEHMYAEHAAEEIEMGLQEAKEGEGEGREEEPDVDDDKHYNGEGGGQEELDQYHNDNGHAVDVDDDEDLVEYDDNSVDGDEDPDENDDNTIDDDEDPDEYDDDTVDDEEDSDNEDFDEDDDISDHDDEGDEMVEEDEIDGTAELQNDDNNVEESDDNQRNTVEGNKQETVEEENQKKEGGSLKKQVLSKGSQRKNQRNTVEERKKQEHVQEENEEIKGGSSQKKSREGSEWKKVTTLASEKVASKSKDGQGDAMEEADQEKGKEVIQDKEESHKQKVKKLKKRRRGKVSTEGFKELTSDGKVELSQRKKSSKKVESMGMIFMCSSKTKRDCYQYKVLGLPANKRDEVRKVYKGMRLFLYDFDLKLMYGIYKAAGTGGYNIQPRAFNSQFPSQVRFTVLEDCLPLAEEKFREVIKDNYYTKTKFNCRLTSQQVTNLCKLFVSSSKGAKSEVLARRPKARPATDQLRSRAPERQSALDEKRRHLKYSAKRKREVVEYSSKRKRKVVAPPVAAALRVLAPPAASAPLYAYDRAMEIDAYRRDLSVKHLDSHRHPYPEPLGVYRAAPLVEYRDIYRRDPLLDRLDSYMRDVAAVENLGLRERPEHHDLRYQDEIRRHARYISYRERPQHHDLRYQDDLGRRDLHLTYRLSPENLILPTQDDIGRRDPYISYRERLAYRDRVYGSSSRPEHDHYHPISRSTEYGSAVAAPPEYRSAAAALPEYLSARPLHRY